MHSERLMMTVAKPTIITTLLVLLGLAVPLLAQEQHVPPYLNTTDTGETVQMRPVYSPYAGKRYPTGPLFGDTHLHTSSSMDAGAAGARLDPNDAYRFARGEEVMASSGQRVRLSRPLDFLVVADHSDGFGFSRC